MIKKRILHISKYYKPFRGGTEQIAQDCVDALGDKYEQKVICFNHEKEDVFDNIDGIEVIRCGTIAKISSQPLSFSYGKLLKKTITLFMPDIIIFHYPNPFVARYLLKYAPKTCKIILYWHLDIVKQRFLGKFFDSQNIALLKRSDLVCATSPVYIAGSKYLSEFMDKCQVVPNCINVNRLQVNKLTEDIAKSIRNMNKGKIILFSIGRHTEYKGFKYLIEAVQKLDDRFELFIAGKGEETKKLMTQAKGDSNIHFLGEITDEELKAYLIAMDIFCFPSITKNEAFGVALAEAMYFCKPAVTFNIPGSGVNYVCLNNENGIEVPNKDVNAYAKGILELADNPSLRKKMGENAYKRVSDNFLNEQFVLNINDIIIKLMS